MNDTWNVDARMEREFWAFPYFAETGAADHLEPPILQGMDIWCLHYCIMHAAIPFGKDMLNYMWKWCATDAQKKMADQFFDKLQAKICFERGPNKINGNWHIKATETFNWFQKFPEFCELVGYSGPALHLVEEMLHHFKTLYKWEFKTPEDELELQAYERDFPVFVDSWRDNITGYDKYRNYYHTLAHEVPRSIRHRGSAWKYASDITETYVCIIKNQVLDHTTRGGLKMNPAKQLLERMAVRSACYSNGLGSTTAMISPWETKRLQLLVQDQ